MLYILPPPSAPSPPSPWTTILCGGSDTPSSGIVRGGTVKAVAGGAVATVVKRNSWVTATATGNRPPTPRGQTLRNLKTRDSGAGASVDDEDPTRNSRSLSECYFAGKGAALVLPPNERLYPSAHSSTNSNNSSNGNVSSNGGHHSRRVSASSSDIQRHLQSMFYLLRPEETLKMAVKLESVHSGRTRYLVVVSCVGRQDAEESCLLGIDCNEKTTVGLVLRVLADTAITLDGDGGFSVSVCGQQHIFKPVSVQAMWSALQTLHKVSSKARERNYFLGGLTHDWVSYYEQRIESDRSCLNEWHAMDSLESRRPPSPDSVRSKPHEREETERVIRCTLKEIMMSVDLDEVTSKYIRGRLEEDLDMDLGEFKPFIDQEMLTILGQMDAATEIFDHVYLGSEWNASNLEELQKNGVHHILNVTREIDNFFPGMFNYLNVRVYDDEKTDLLKHWDNTFKYITRARKEGSKVLVHCKMGVSRSASVVIAYAMKAYNWDFKEAFEYVKQKRNCIKPNASFISQLETYQGILVAMKNREKLQRSKSETNLKSPGLVAKAEQRTCSDGTRGAARPEPVLSLESQVLGTDWTTTSGEELSRHGGRPKSWSPDNSATALLLLGNVTGPTSVSLEQLNLEGVSPVKQDMSATTACSQLEIKLPEPSPQDGIPPVLPRTETTDAARNYNLNVRMPCGNGQAYSVSQNKVMYLPASCCQEKQSVSEVECSSVAEGVVPSVKHRVSELELQNSYTNGTASKKISLDRKGLVLNLTTQFESSGSKPSSPSAAEEEQERLCSNTVGEGEHTAQSQTKPAPQMLTAVLVKKEIWDPGEKESPTIYAVEHITPGTSSPPSTPVSQPTLPSNNDCLVWTTTTEMVEKCVHEPLTNKAEDVIFVSELKLGDTETVERLSAQSVGQNKVVTGSKMLPRREGDPFSAQLDRVFEREERKQQRIVIPGTMPPTNVTLPPPPPPPLPPSVTELSNDAPSRECPSRQSSWSSYDSAVVLGFQGEARDAPSRQSSWGSGDTRWTYGGGGTLPSRNSSWGSYDMRPPMQYVNERGEKQTHLDDLFGNSSGMFPYDRDEIPWYPGTVKRTKQKLEEGTGTVKRMCSDVQQRSESPASPVAGSQESPSPSSIRAGDSTPGMNVKIHGPRPYRSPSSCRLLPTTDFSFPSSDPHSSDHSGNMGIQFEAESPVIVHYASSPTLCSRHGIGSESDDSLSAAPGSTEKMASSQPNITFLNSSAANDRLVEEVILQQCSAISRRTDFNRESCSAVVVPHSPPHTLCSLSASAPATSSVSLLEGIEPLTPPSHSLPSVSSVCLVPRDLSAAVSCESVSETSPCIINTTQCTSVRHQKRVLEKLTNVTRRSISVDCSADVTKDANALARSPEVVDSQKSVSGLVKNLKKEFEAKSVNKTEKCSTTSTELPASDSDERRSSDALKAHSLPSSPVSSHPQCKAPNSPCSGSPSTTEDLSVKVLVGKYEVSKNTVGLSDSPPLGRRHRFSENETLPRRTVVSQQQPPVPLRKSSLEIPYIQNNANKHSSLLVRNLRNGKDGPNARPPTVPHSRSCVGPSPSVVVANVVAKAASKKQQQGKTHPLARLMMNKPRHTNTVYNTM